MNTTRRIEALERRMREPSPRSSGRAREYLSGFLRRYAAARQQGAITEELETEVRSVLAALERRLTETRGEGCR